MDRIGRGDWSVLILNSVVLFHSTWLQLILPVRLGSQMKV